MTLKEKVEKCTESTRWIQNQFPEVNNVNFKIHSSEEEFDDYVFGKIPHAKSRDSIFGNFSQGDTTIIVYFEKEKAEPSKERGYSTNENVRDPHGSKSPLVSNDELNDLYKDEGKDTDRYHR